MSIFKMYLAYLLLQVEFPFFKLFVITFTLTAFYYLCWLLLGYKLSLGTAAILTCIFAWTWQFYDYRKKQKNETNENDEQ